MAEIPLQPAVAEESTQLDAQSGVFKYHVAHSPNAPFSVRRTERHCLPPGAELLEKSPADMAETRKDGRIELRVERTIPAGGSMEVSCLYRLAESNKAQAIRKWGGLTLRRLD